jgi:uncharacterized membrane protein
MKNISFSIRTWGATAAVAVMTWAGLAKGASTAPQTLVYASYDNEQGATQAFNAMKESQKQGAIQIESYAVIAKDQNGRVHVQSTQKSGAKAGAVVGALVGVLGGPPGVAVGAGAGGAIGYLTGESVGIPHEDIKAIKAALKPGTSAVVAVVDERWVSDAERALHEGNAREVLDHQLAGTAGGGNVAPSNAGTEPSGNAPEQSPNPGTQPSGNGAPAQKP